MEAFFIFLSVLSLLYFLVIVVYSGIGTSFCGVWIFFALLFALMAGFCHRTKGQSGERGLPRRFPVAVFTSFGAGLCVFGALMFPVLKTAKAPAEPGLSYVVVLGTKVYPDRLSNSLLKRLDRAYAYYRENPDTVLILSGGQGPDEPVPEALAMYNYLYRKGVPDWNMRVEIFSENTEENIRYSMLQIEMDRARRERTVWETYDLPAPKEKRLGIITSDYHLYRASGIAKKEGIETVCPIAAPSDPVLFLHACVRESAAILKDHIMGNLTF